MGERKLNYPLSFNPEKLEATFSFDVVKHLYIDIRDYLNTV